VFAKHGMTGALKALGQPARIDRAFVKGFTVQKATVNPVSRAISDHDFGRFVVAPIPPKPVPPKPIPTAPLHGVDVSSHQGADWIPAPGDDFTIVKTSEGTTYTSPVRWSQVSAARTAGLVVGHYHYMWPGNPLEQARFFVANAEAQPGEILALDWETTAGGHPTVDEAAVFIAEVQRLAPGHRVLLYCNQSDWVSTTVKAPDGLWIAHYGVDKPKTTTPWIFHQYTDDPIDKNWSSFTKIEDLKAWAAGG
jgi:GH25 family lysozyme M1 (1,4-beta-N-acetylmuramidase)